MKKILSILLTFVALYTYGQNNYDHLGKIRMLYGGKTTTWSYSGDTTLCANDSKFFKFSGQIKADSIVVNGTTISPWVLNLKADKATTLTAGYGLSGGGNLSANRSFAVDSSKITTVYANSLKANKAITISVGWGLSGGGDLSTNRTIGADSSKVTSVYANSLKVDKVGGKGLSTNDYTNGAVSNVLYATPRLADAWSDTLKFDRIYIFHNQKRVSANITPVIKATGTIQGSYEKIVFIGDSVHNVSFAGMNKKSQSLDWNDSLTNYTTFEFDGVDVWYYITR